jgi:hypothetical protein
MAKMKWDGLNVGCLLDSRTPHADCAASDCVTVLELEGKAQNTAPVDTNKLKPFRLTQPH